MNATRPDCPSSRDEAPSPRPSSSDTLGDNRRPDTVSEPGTAERRRSGRAPRQLSLEF